jgi:hypothetical protein
MGIKGCKINSASSLPCTLLVTAHTITSGITFHPLSFFFPSTLLLCYLNFIDLTQFTIMAQILEGIVGDEIPSTPPETNQERQNNPPGSIRRESSRIRTPSTRPGFVRTESDSRLALGSKPSGTQINRSRKATIRTPVTDKTNISELGNDREDSVSIVEQHQVCPPL